MDDGKLQDYVNSSGFPLQIGIQKQIEESRTDLGWKVMSGEVPWRNKETGNNGFIDLIVTDQSDVLKMIIECKRVRDTKWIFLNPSKKEAERNHARIFMTYILNKRRQYFDWRDIQMEPSSPESEFCIVPGQDPKSKPMLERSAAELLEAVEAIADVEYHIHEKNEMGCPALYLPSIVTTAELQVCTFDPADISVRTGEIQKTASFRKVPFVRFRKTLSVGYQSHEGFKNIKDFARAKERTVFVINSESIIDFIQKIVIPDRQFHNILLSSLDSL
jgi:hypothetical protein